MESNGSIVPMDIQTKQWLIGCIDSAPDSYSLEGIRVTIEWFYSIDKDIDSFDYFLNRIVEKYKLL